MTSFTPKHHFTLFNSEPKQYCDFPENVECGDRPLCDTNDQNCEEREYTTGWGGHLFLRFC